MVGSIFGWWQRYILQKLASEWFNFGKNGREKRLFSGKLDANVLKLDFMH